MARQMSGTASGTTAMLGAPVAGSSVAVAVSVVSATPVVDGEYKLVNACWFGTRTSGPADSPQKDAVSAGSSRRRPRTGASRTGASRTPR